ncbi:hypothetical protein [Bacillus atrophaeus]|uniref:hypothetical protein n=1 Tax=Bacillus atrophaeus TaxID=1452 RepID=UPI002E1F6C6F|nr:hypothetical protein [Bacillus atrophaeus]MED1120957.1 hypothetical protein [Bacillus atrophaeus]
MAWRFFNCQSKRKHSVVRQSGVDVAIHDPEPAKRSRFFLCPERSGTDCQLSEPRSRTPIAAMEKSSLRLPGDQDAEGDPWPSGLNTCRQESV